MSGQFNTPISDKTEIQPLKVQSIDDRKQKYMQDNMMKVQISIYVVSICVILDENRNENACII